MMSIIWGLMIICAIGLSLINGNIEILNEEIINSSKAAIDMVISIMPILILWMGLMQIASDSGLLMLMANKLGKILKFIFPSVPKENKALGYIASNVIVNMMGLGSAATPFGLKAMEELQKINKQKEIASNAMITFLILNTGGVTIIPTTIISLRKMHGSSNPTEIIITAVFATFCACISGLIIDRIIRGKKND